MDETVYAIERLIEGGGQAQHVVLNAAKVVQAQSDPELRAAIEQCQVINADGMSIVWASRWLGVPLPERVTGIDLMDRVLALAARRGWPVYFLGAHQQTVERAVALEKERHAGLLVGGHRNGYWTPQDEGEVVCEVAAAAPTILLVAMPSPRKEQFLARHRQQLSIPFVMGVGGSFDVVAGVTRRAPAWMQRSGLEWAYRLKLEPRRMARRYIVGNSRFLALVAKERRTQRRGSAHR